MSKIIESGCGNTTILADDEVPNEVYVSDTEKEQIEKICKEEEAGSFLRVAVMGGGCAGFRYIFGLDTDLEDDDIVNDWGSSKLVVDLMSMEYMKGSTINYVEENMSALFKVDNALASSQCGCGTSFAV